ncbi:MAG: AmmeMemoRadiSam system protein B [Planctomycetota bacterium]|jgi:AmmeMemoRadiSam system protein B/AmmeMemoRadiSam system protein A
MDTGKKPYARKFLTGAVVILLAAVVLFICKPGILDFSVATEEPSAPKKGSPAGPLRDVLRCSLAGSWYDDDPKALDEQFETFFRKADAKTIDNVIALILPHAGYRWSGQTAAFALKATDKQYKRIIVIGPSHRTAMEEMLSVPRATHYQTPLGQVPLDVEFIDKLLKFSFFQNLPYALKQENSVEMEVPLLQYRQKDFKLVLIIAGRCSLATIRKAGTVLRGLVDADTLVVASSDFVHYGRGHRYVPFTDNIPQRIKDLDMGAYEFIANRDAKGFLEYRRKTGATICGTMSIAVLLSMLDEGTTAHLVKYTTSSELTGDFSNSVSYLAAAFAGTWSGRPEIEPQQGRAQLTPEDKKKLLALARKSIVYYLENKRIPQPADLNVAVTAAMESPRAAFVTLKKEARLRGCIGDIFPQRPLYKSVIYNAVNAAVNDRRFMPVTRDECRDIAIEISALTPPEPVASADQIRIGTDGMVLRKDGRSAVFLPQVAPEQGWDLNETLSKLSQKAGLPPDAWKQGARFLVFQAVVFGEEK